MARIKVQGTHLYYQDGNKIVRVQCAKELTLGADTESDMDVTCLDDPEDNFDVGKTTPGEGSIVVDLDDENPSHLNMVALSKTSPRKKVQWFLGTSNSKDAPTITGGTVTLPTTRTWLTWEGYLKTPDRTFVKGEHVGYTFPMRRTTSVNEVFRTVPSTP